MAQQTFAGVPAEFTAGEVLSSSDQNLLRNFLIAQIKEGMTGDTGEILPMIMDLTNNRIVLDAGGLEFSNGSTQTVAATAGISWSGSTANGIGTYGSSSSVVAESTATYDGTTLQLTTSGGGLKLDGLGSSNVNTLDDYEEGTFTGGLTAASGTITVNASYDQLAYTKIGRLVSICGTLEMTSISSPSGALTLTGLPFTSASSGTGAPERSARLSFFFLAGALVSGEPDWFGSINENSATADLRYGAGGTGAGGTNPAAQIDGGSFMQFSMSYIAAT